MHPQALLLTRQSYKARLDAPHFSATGDSPAIAVH
jgi:hypothetical protein